MKSTLILSLVLMIGCPAVLLGDPSDFVAPDAKLEWLFDGGCKIAEGIAIASDNTVYISDITFTKLCRDSEGNPEAGHIWQYSPTTGQTKIFRSPSGMSNGMKFDAKGRLIVCEMADFGGRRVTRTDMKTGKATILAALYEGRPFNGPNDVAIDEKGRVYFTDPRYLGHESIDQPVMGVYRIDVDGSIHRILSDVGKPNGIAVSPDQKSLYVVSHDNGTTGMFRLPEGTKVLRGRNALLAYDLADEGTPTFRKTLVEYERDGPDGMEVDTEGHLWVAVRDEERPGVYVYSTEGEELAYIRTKMLTNVGFGRGELKNMLYITSENSLYRIKVKKEGYHVMR
jgi:gluconolactonase